MDQLIDFYRSHITRHSAALRWVSEPLWKVLKLDLRFCFASEIDCCPLRLHPFRLYSISLSSVMDVSSSFRLWEALWRRRAANLHQFCSPFRSYGNTPGCQNRKWVNDKPVADIRKIICMCCRFVGVGFDFLLSHRWDLDFFVTNRENTVFLLSINQLKAKNTSVSLLCVPIPTFALIDFLNVS